MRNIPKPAGALIFSATAVFICFIVLYASYRMIFKPAKDYGVVQGFSFSNRSEINDWCEKVLKGRVSYNICLDESTNDGYLLAESKCAASALYRNIDLDINKRPYISWKWRVNSFPRKNNPEKIDVKNEEDFAARLYVIFLANFFTNSKAIEYVWAENLPEGSSGSSAYSNNIKVMVLRSGKAGNDWSIEERDIFSDYVSLFGQAPKLNVGAISVMTDSDSTKSEAAACYDEIKVGYKK